MRALLKSLISVVFICCPAALQAQPELTPRNTLPAELPLDRDRLPTLPLIRPVGESHLPPFPDSLSPVGDNWIVPLTLLGNFDAGPTDSLTSDIRVTMANPSNRTILIKSECYNNQNGLASQRQSQRIEPFRSGSLFITHKAVYTARGNFSAYFTITEESTCGSSAAETACPPVEGYFFSASLTCRIATDSPIVATAELVKTISSGGSERVSHPIVRR